MAASTLPQQHAHVKQGSQRVLIACTVGLTTMLLWMGASRCLEARCRSSVLFWRSQQEQRSSQDDDAWSAAHGHHSRHLITMPSQQDDIRINAPLDGESLAEPAPERLVVAARYKEDIQWMANKLAGMPYLVYQVRHNMHIPLPLCLAVTLCKFRTLSGLCSFDWILVLVVAVITWCSISPYGSLTNPVDSATAICRIACSGSSSDSSSAAQDGDPEAPLRVQPGPGTESKAYLQFIVDNYHNLPNTTVFIHAHRESWWATRQRLCRTAVRMSVSHHL